MESQQQNTNDMKTQRKTSKLLFTACILASLTAGWILGSLTTKAFSQSDSKKCKSLTSSSTNILLPVIAMNGETLPTITLKETFVIAN